MFEGRFGEDFSNKEKLAKLARFKSSTHNSENDFVSLKITLLG